MRPARPRWRLSAYLLRERARLGAGSAAMALRAAVALLLPWPLKFIVDSVIFRKPLGAWAALLPDPQMHRLVLLHVLGAAIVLLGVLDAALAYVGNRLLLDGAQRIGFALRRDFFAHLLRLPQSFHRERLSGELATRIGGDVNALQQFVAAVGLDLLPQLLTIGGIFVVMLAMNWRYGLITLAVAPVLIGIARHFAAAIRSAARETRREEGLQSGAVQETLGNIQLVQACAREAFEERRFTARARGVLEAALRGNRMQAGFAPAMNLAIALATGAIAWYGAVLVLNGTLSAGDLLVFLAYLRAIVTPARQLAKAGRVFGRAAVALERIEEYWGHSDAMAQSGAGRDPQRCLGVLEFHQVTFGYGAERATVREVSFGLEPGRTVALVGATGAGKSTLAALAARFHDPQAGAVTLDGVDLRELTLHYVRSHIALIGQEPQLFHGPVWANIAYGREDAGRDEAIAAARAAGIEDVLAALPEGFDTVVGERGATLSGGQRQCVAVARAMLSGAAVIILDEPSSSVDPLTEQRLMRAVKSLARTCAVLLIAHRLATVMAAETILVLEEGVIVQRGTHAQLLGAGGAYASLWQAHRDVANAHLRLAVSA